MSRSDIAAHHQVYLVEIWGDTAVVIPRGDAAGFHLTMVTIELATVTELVQAPAIKHLIIDLGSANYFGSVILGGLVQMGQTVRNRGGRIGICQASKDMQDVLRLMKLESMWEMYPDRSAALRAIAKIPIKRRLWAWRHALRWGAGLAAVVLLYLFYPRPNYGEIYHREMASLWREFQEKHTRAGNEEWERFKRYSIKRLEPVIDHINRRALASRWTEPERYLLYAARDHWKLALDRDSPYSRIHVHTVEQYLQSAQVMLQQESGRQFALSGRPNHAVFTPSNSTTPMAADELVPPAQGRPPATGMPSSPPLGHAAPLR